MNPSEPDQPAVAQDGADTDGANIIPIGTRGRPGRGTGSHQPSAAARGLANGTARRTTAGPARKKPGRPRETPEPIESIAVEADGASGGSEDAMPEVRTLPLRNRTEAAEPVEEAVEATGSAERSHPIQGIPLADWSYAVNLAAREVFGEDWEPQLARFLAFLRRRVTGDYTVDAYGFDAEITHNFFLAVLRPIAQKWFRIQVVGAENIPATGGALVVSNHSGTLPLDALMTTVQVHDHSGRYLRPLGADLVFRMPFVSSIARKAGATLACSEDAERMLRDGELVGVWPEGFKGIGKPFSERYKLQRFGRGGFVGAALRTGVPIIPVSVVGAEEIYPLVGNVPALAKALGLPYLPITPFFPLLGPLGMLPLPSKWLIEFGEPIRTDTYDAGAADDPMLVFDVTDQIRETIQQTLFGLLQKRQSVFR